MSQDTLATIKTRRVIRNMTDQPVEREALEKIRYNFASTYPDGETYLKVQHKIIDKALKADKGKPKQGEG